MDLLRNAYGSEESEAETPHEDRLPTDGESGSSAQLKPQLLKKAVTSAPYVNPALKTLVMKPGYIPPEQGQLMTNVKAATLLAPMYGPAHPHRRELDVQGGKKLATGGYTEEAEMESWNFHEQFHTYNSYGYARDGATGAVIGDARKFGSNKGETIFDRSGAAAKKSVKVSESKKRKAEDAHEHAPEEETKAGEESDELGDDEEGPWAPMKDTRIITELEAGTLTASQEKFRKEVAERRAQRYKEYDMDEDHDRRDERKIAHLLPPRHDRDTKAMEATSQFHGKEQKDYQGRSWVQPPAGLRAGEGDHQCYIPKRCIHKYTGHTKGVQAIQFFPTYGHLLLSGSLDGKCKIWDVYNERQVKRTYSGHSAAIRAIDFNSDGSRFLSAGFDRFIRLWDTETGQCINHFTNRKVPYCVKFYPPNENQFICGMSDNRLNTFDITTGEIVQEYNHHLASVNTITFYDEYRRFASTSDDKKMLLWEWDIPVPIKYIAEPEMQSMPAVTSHPSNAFMACQSLDNTIRVYGTKDRFKEMRKKVFRGHTIAGYACQLAFSPNGKFLVSGDGEGKLFFWDWKSTKLYSKYKAHDNGPTIGCQWHPVEPSWVATCGWDGVIKLWD